MSLAHYLDISSIVHQWNQELIGLWETSKEITKQHNSQKCTCGFACTCMWRPEVSPGCWPSGAALLAFWNWSLTRTWDLPVRQGCLDGQLQVSASIPFLSTEITCFCHNAWLLMWCRESDPGSRVCAADTLPAWATLTQSLVFLSIETKTNDSPVTWYLLYFLLLPNVYALIHYLKCRKLCLGHWTRRRKEKSLIWPLSVSSLPGSPAHIG